MVNKIHYHENHLEPPAPMGEEWWEAVLAEEETISGQQFARTFRSAHSGAHWEDEQKENYPDEGLDWQTAFELYEQDQVVQMQVVGCNRGGVIGQRRKSSGVCTCFSPGRNALQGG